MLHEHEHIDIEGNDQDNRTEPIDFEHTDFAIENFDFPSLPTA